MKKIVRTITRYMCIKDYGAYKGIGGFKEGQVYTDEQLKWVGDFEIGFDFQEYFICMGTHIEWIKEG